LDQVAMNKKTPSGAAPVQPWRKRCERFPNLFAPLGGSAAEQRRAERWEADAIAIVVCDLQPLAVRAEALRSIVELRECTVRQVAMFFELEADVAIAALSLVPEAAKVQPAAPAIQPATPVIQSAMLPALVKAA
jgi:hypothetical protein